MKNLNLFSLLATALLASFNATAMETIVGGSDVLESDPIAHTTALLVGQTAEGQYICSSSIIAPDTMVTAAHCVNAPADKIRIVFALAVDKDHPPGAGQIMAITGYVANPDYKGETYQGIDMGDIAVIHLNGTVPEGYRAATILNSESDLAVGQKAVLAGYGITAKGNTASAGTLRETNVQITEILGNTEIMVDMSHNKGMCGGDSGGPAFLERNGQLFLWGVTSRADRDCAKLGIYTKIPSYADWIQSTAASLR